MTRLEARVVGGGVRNPLLGLPIKDELDLASPYKPERVMRLAPELGFSAVPIKIDHGTVLLVKGQEKYEVTTLRQDVLTDGRWAKVRYTHSWRQDAERRDFTINALYMDAKGKIYDYVGGLKDIERKILRFVGDPETRIREDYLRIIRLFRFWAHYVRPAKRDIVACAELSGGLAQISKERILAEMLKLYSAHDPWEAVRSMYENHIIVMNDGSKLEAIERQQRLTPLTRLALTVDVTSLPLSRQQSRWIKAFQVRPDSLHDILEAFHEHGKTFAQDYALFYAPEHLSKLPKHQEKFPILPSELPVPPGPEMGIRFKAIHKWWMRQPVPPTREECFKWYKEQYPDRLE